MLLMTWEALVIGQKSIVKEMKNPYDKTLQYAFIYEYVIILSNKDILKLICLGIKYVTSHKHCSNGVSKVGITRTMCLILL